MSQVSHASATNQRLDAARRLLQQSQMEQAQWLVGSLESSAVYQLRSAVNGLLQEIKQGYRLKADQLTIEQLQQAAATAEQSIPVLNELSQQLSQPQSWLRQLFERYDTQFECRQSPVQTATPAQLIGKGSDGGASTKFILDALVELVLRYREDASEY
ncbi:hypothetical protein FJM67_01105 [Maribrevibacterium harenarium]|uniref:Uncharacterized protein n=1 Tax=Maribrevibacterium harenarium TaxID=2589817 RepID=A0A501X5G1_9GAMM|nr:DUF6586 family protein [Maribrevibacterium harenarium]TPE55679.1 hypothetical protein FJM67_01105 [Maribrevibacterium harenarium]